MPDVAPFDETSAAYAGKVRAYLAKLKPNAQPIGPLDSLIAGQALALGACIVTGSTGEFQRVPGLLVEDWGLADSQRE
jgi:tRNA(fMet)-specific endonuclease VapC